jgi:hypothetical protein
MFKRPPVETRHRNLEALPFGANQVCDRHAAVLEQHHRSRLSLPAEFLFFGAKRQTARALLDHDARNTAWARFTRPCHHDIEVGHASAGGEGFGTVEHEMLAVAPRPRSQARRIGP